MKQPWYAGGLRFTCTGCGDCCTGAPGAVWVNGSEIATLAEHLAISVEEFEKTYVRTLGRGRSLFEHFNGDCVFFDPDSRGCRVYQARPVQCRTWPFWDDNLDSPRAWRLAEGECPGAGEGKLVPLERIVAQLKRHRDARDAD